MTFSESTKAKFKDLNLDKLKYLANKTWVEQSKEKFGFPSDSIEKTILYKIKSIEKGQLHNEISDEQWEKHKGGLRKYAIIFYTDRTYSTNDVETGQQVMDIVQGKSQINTDPELSRLMRATGQNSCFPPKNRRFFQKEDFDEIYKKKCLPDGPPWDEWLFLAHAEGIRIPGYVKIERNDVTLYKNPNYGSSVQERIGFFYDDYLPGKGLITESLTDKWEKLIPRWAITNGYIEAKKLTCLLAKDEDYIPLLPGLWEDFQVGISGDPCPHPGGFDSRIDAWAGLLYRWVNDEAFGLKVQELKKIEIVGDGEDIKIPLKEIKRYFIELSQVPLPESLFPDGSQEGGINLYDSLSLPAQEIKEGPAPESTTGLDNNADPGISNKQVLNDAIHSVSKDVEQLYEGMKGLLKAQGLPLSQADKTQQKEACKNFYDQNSNKFSILKQNHVESAIKNSKYWESDSPARDIKGGLFEQFIIHKHSYLTADKNLKTNYQDLYTLSRKLKKTV